MARRQPTRGLRIAGGAAWLAACTPAAPARAPASQAGGGTVHLLLHDPRTATGPSRTCDSDLCRPLLDLIHRAYQTIDLAVYGVRGQPELLSALADARDGLGYAQCIVRNVYAIGRSGNVECHFVCGNDAPFVMMHEFHWVLDGDDMTVRIFIAIIDHRGKAG